jgi:hypothetical protein
MMDNCGMRRSGRSWDRTVKRFRLRLAAQLTNQVLGYLCGADTLPFRPRSVTSTNLSFVRRRTDRVAQKA